MNGDRATGSLLGLALGDSLAAPVEFSSVATILERYPPSGPREPESAPARVTDDTQMALAVGHALLDARSSGGLSPKNLERTLRARFVEWLHDPENNRAPGLTCLKSCGRLERGLRWQEATDPNSKGCGANMRVAPVAFLHEDAFGVDATARAGIAQFQAALTHGHPTALAASDLTVAAIALLADGVAPGELIDRLGDYADLQRSVYHERWLGSLWRRPYLAEAEAGQQAFISRGWDDCLLALHKLRLAVESDDKVSDPCLATGQGWIAEEAFATGLLCFLLYPDDPVAALRRAATTSGDSDSIACLTGAFAGAAIGTDAWPNGWVERIEYRDELLALGRQFDSSVENREIGSPGADESGVL